jgi:hypothetical protein
MTTLTDLKARALQVLSDTQGTRYNSNLMDEAFTQALDRLNLRLPRLMVLNLSITTPGRDQPIPDMERCLFIVSVCLVNPTQLTRELQPDSEFTFQRIDALPALHFTGARYPLAGDALQIQYAQAFTLADIDAGTLPLTYETALVTGAAGQANLMRASQLIEAYGNRSDDTPRLLEVGRLRLDSFEALLSALRVQQDFSSPPGFALDKFDRNGSGRYA